MFRPVLRTHNDGKMSYYALRDVAVASLLDHAFSAVAASASGNGKGAHDKRKGAP